jgi:hypothetical protein
MNNSGCPANWKLAFDEFALCGDGDTPTGCLVESTNCGLQTVALSMATRPGATYCFYDWVSEELVGITYFQKDYGCQSLDASFPPYGFLQGECGPGSFDSPYD